MDCCNDGANGGFEWFGEHYNTYTHCCVDSTVTQYCAQASGSGSVALECKNIKMDVLFLIDESGSVGPSNFAKNLAFAADFINELDLDDDLTKVGFAKFDHSFTNVFDFSSDHDSVILNLQSTNYNAGATAIGDALQSVADDFDSGDFAWRPQTESWVIVMTDGKDSNSATITSAVSNLVDIKGTGQPTVNLVAVGIGAGVDVGQISAIASDPSYAYTIAGYNQLNTIKESLGTAMCV
jgi:collagen type VI alpha